MPLLIELLVGFFIPAPDIKLTEPNVTISFRAGNEIFPSYWQTKDIDPKATPISTQKEDRCLKKLKIVISKYPIKLTETHLKNIYVTKSLQFYGLAYGGTNSHDSIYLTLPTWTTDNYDLKFLERVYHHELSSIFLRNNPSKFPQSKWNLALPKDFEYRGNGTQSLREGTASTKYDPELNEKGFLAQYSTSSLEEDFNLFAEALFSGDQEFWRIHDKYPAIAAKANIMVEFYQSLDPSLTFEKLRHFAQTQVQ